MGEKEKTKINMPMKDLPKKLGVFSHLLNQNFISLVGRRMLFRAAITFVILAIFMLLLYLFFFKSNLLPDRTRDLLNITIGAYITSFTRIIDFWFKKDDEDSKEDKIDPFDGSK